MNTALDCPLCHTPNGLVPRVTDTGDPVWACTVCAATLFLRSTPGCYAALARALGDTVLADHLNALPRHVSHPPEVVALRAWVAAHHIVPDTVDDLVLDVVTQSASDLYNTNQDRGLVLLLDTLGLAETQRLLREASASLA